MSDRLTALRALEGRIEEGAWTVTHWKDFNALCDPILAHRAYHGSLDSAKELHDTVLPGWEWSLGPLNARVMPYNSETGQYRDGMASNPARAWLLVIIRALIWQKENRDESDN